MVGLFGSGPSIFGFVSVSFEFRSRCRNFTGSGEIWPIFGRIRGIWTRSRRNIVGSRWIWWISSRTSSEKQKYHRYLSYFVRIPLNVVGCFDLMVGSGGSSFWGGNPPTDPKGSGSVHGDLPPTIKLVGSVVADRFRVGPAGWSGDEDPWTPLTKSILLWNSEG